MADVEDFLGAPSEEFLECCSRDQLVKIAAHFQVDVGDKQLKENMRGLLKENMVERGGM